MVLLRVLKIVLVVVLALDRSRVRRRGRERGGKALVARFAFRGVVLTGSSETWTDNPWALRAAPFCKGEYIRHVAEESFV